MRYVLKIMSKNRVANPRSLCLFNAEDMLDRLSLSKL